MTYLLDDLEKQALIERARDPGDRRSAGFAPYRSPDLLQRADSGSDVHRDEREKRDLPAALSRLLTADTIALRA